MGCACSSERRAGASLDAQLVAALKRKGAERKAAGHTLKSLDVVLLRLPALRALLNSCRGVFAASHADGVAGIRLDEFQQHAAQALQLHLPPEQLQAVFAEADLDGDRLIDFKEFIVLVVLCWLLRPASEPDAGLAALHPALETLLDAFLLFDRRGRGLVTRADVDAVLRGGGGDAHAHAPATPRGGGAGHSASRRFSEMDLDHSGGVSFPEFILTLEGWAEVGEEE